MNYKKPAFWKRSVAYLIDVVLLSIFTSVIQIIFPFPQEVEFRMYLLLFLSYNILMDYYLQGTLGKGLLGLEVMRKGGIPPSFLNCFYRNIGKYISFFVFGYGYFRILAPHRMQTIHDEIGQCLVVQQDRKTIQEKDKYRNGEIWK